MFQDDAKRLRVRVRAPRATRRVRRGGGGDHVGIALTKRGGARVFARRGSFLRVAARRRARLGFARGAPLRVRTQETRQRAARRRHRLGTRGNNTQGSFFFVFVFDASVRVAYLRHRRTFRLVQRRHVFLVTFTFTRTHTRLFFVEVPSGPERHDPLGAETGADHERAALEVQVLVRVRADAVVPAFVPVDHRVVAGLAGGARHLRGERQKPQRRVARGGRLLRPVRVVPVTREPGANAPAV